MSRRLFAIALLALLTAACTGMSESPLRRAGGAAASTLAATAETIEAFRSGAMTRAYLEGSLVVYRESLSASVRELRSALGALDESGVEAIVEQIGEIEARLEAACWSPNCPLPADPEALRELSNAARRLGSP